MNITTTEGKQITLAMPFQFAKDSLGTFIKAIGQDQWYKLVGWPQGQAPVVSWKSENGALYSDALSSLPSGNLRAFQVSYVGPTDHRPSRIKIIDHYNKESITISNEWIYQHNRITDGAKAYLNSIGIEITQQALSDSMDLLLSPNFETRIKK